VTNRTMMTSAMALVHGLTSEKNDLLFSL
jgi:hypothetical protein